MYECLYNSLFPLSLLYLKGHIRPLFCKNHSSTFKICMNTNISLFLSSLSLSLSSFSLSLSLYLYLSPSVFPSYYLSVSVSLLLFPLSHVKLSQAGNFTTLAFNMFYDHRRCLMLMGRAYDDKTCPLIRGWEVNVFDLVRVNVYVQVRKCLWPRER